MSNITLFLTPSKDQLIFRKKHYVEYIRLLSWVGHKTALTRQCPRLLKLSVSTAAPARPEPGMQPGQTVGYSSLGHWLVSPHPVTNPNIHMNIDNMLIIYYCNKIPEKFKLCCFLLKKVISRVNFFVDCNCRSGRKSLDSQHFQREYHNKLLYIDNIFIFFIRPRINVSGLFILIHQLIN